MACDFICQHLHRVFTLPRMADMFQDSSYFIILIFYLKCCIFKKFTDENNLLTILIHLAVTSR